MKPSLLIEDFKGDWEKEWFTYRPQEWGRRTHKVYHPRWAAPEGAQLALQVRCEKANKLVVGLDDFAVERSIEGGGEWQNVVLKPADFKNVADEPMEDWKGIRQLRLGAQETLRDRKKNLVTKRGAVWQGEAPDFRNLRWIQPEGSAKVKK